MRMRLQGKFIVFISLLLLSVGAVFTFINIKGQEKIIINRMLDKADAMATIFAENSADMIHLLRVRELRLFIDEALKHHEVTYAYVFDEDGAILTDGSGSNELRYLVLDDPISQKSIKATSTLFQLGPELLDITEPVYMGNRRIGGVRLGFSLEKMNEEISSIRNRNILLGASFTLVGIFLAFAFVKTITNPISSLIAGTKKVSEGDLDNKIDVQTNDELQILADSFNHMTDSLKTSREEITRVNARLQHLLSSSPSVIYSSGTNGSLGITFVSDNVTSLLGYDPQEFTSNADFWSDHMHPDEREHVASNMNTLYDQGHHTVEYRFLNSAGEYRWLHDDMRLVYDSANEPLEIIGSCIDVTNTKEVEGLLQEHARDLMRSNADLQQFAYVASHDLKEPLRMVVNYVQLLEESYKDKLDDEARLFISFIVDGAMNMKDLIDGLLEYSRIGAPDQKFVQTSCEEVFESVVNSLQMAIDESGATVTHDELPVVNAVETQMFQLFQNLIGNAIKFRSERPAQIHVSAESGKDGWTFSVRDNGIGLESKYVNKIFIIFQRLYTKDEYPGTGIGLALCKKIVEWHGGRIWIESEPNKGTTFYFILPA